jgi:hypothetical protein
MSKHINILHVNAACLINISQNLSTLCFEAEWSPCASAVKLALLWVYSSEQGIGNDCSISTCLNIPKDCMFTHSFLCMRSMHWVVLNYDERRCTDTASGSFAVCAPYLVHYQCSMPLLLELLKQFQRTYMVGRFVGFVSLRYCMFWVLRLHAAACMHA